MINYLPRLRGFIPVQLKCGAPPSGWGPACLLGPSPAHLSLFEDPGGTSHDLPPPGGAETQE